MALLSVTRWPSLYGHFYITWSYYSTPSSWLTHWGLKKWPTFCRQYFFKCIFCNEKLYILINISLCRAEFITGNIKIILHFLSISTSRWHRLSRSFLMKDIFLLRSPYHSCRWHGNTRSQGIGSHGIDLVIPEYSGPDSLWKCFLTGIGFSHSSYKYEMVMRLSYLSILGIPIIRYFCMQKYFWRKN